MRPNLIQMFAFGSNAFGKCAKHAKLAERTSSVVLRILTATMYRRDWLFVTCASWHTWLTTVGISCVAYERSRDKHYILYNVMCSEYTGEVASSLPPLPNPLPRHTLTRYSLALTAWLRHRIGNLTINPHPLMASPSRLSRSGSSTQEPGAHRPWVGKARGK